MCKKAFFRKYLPAVLAAAVILFGCNDPATPGDGDKPVIPPDEKEGIPQTVPTGLTVSATGNSGELKATWDAVDGSFFYELQWGTANGYNPLVEVKETSYAVTGLSNGTDYNFRVRSVSGTFESGWSPAATGSPSGTALSDLPAVPGNLTAVGEVVGDYGKIEISWDAADNAASYRLEYGSDPNNWDNATAVDQTARTYTVNVSDVGDFYIRVRSVKGAEMSGSSPVVLVKFNRMVRTLTKPSDDLQFMRTIVVGPGGMLYTVKTQDPHTAWKIDPKSVDFSTPDSSAAYEQFSTSNVKDMGYLALGPDDYLYGAQVWDDRAVYRWKITDTSKNAPSQKVSNNVHADTGKNVDSPLDGGIAVGPDGTMYVASNYEKVVIKIPPPAPDGTPSQAAVLSDRGTYNHDEQQVKTFQNVDSLILGHDGAIYFSDGYNDGQIWRVDPATGTTTPAFGKRWDWGNPFNSVKGIAYYGGYYYFVHEGRAVYKMLPQANANPVLIAGHRDDNGRVDGPALEARFNDAKGIAVVEGAIYVVDRSFHGESTIRVIFPLEVVNY